jgi:hypothetical protein
MSLIYGEKRVSYGPNRYICSVLGEMRECCKTGNYSYLPGLIEEAQMLANRMEASLYDKDDYQSIQKKIKAKKKELKELEAKIEDLT